jgi:hypothetical protein
MTMFQNLHRTLGEGSTLKIECEICRRAAAWPKTLAIQRLGSHTTPADIRRRLTCTRCGSVGCARVWT